MWNGFAASGGELKLVRYHERLAINWWWIYKMALGFEVAEERKNEDYYFYMGGKLVKPKNQ